MGSHRSVAGVTVLADATEPCRWCGETHGKLCPWVKAMEFNGIGDTITRVEFLTPKDYAVQPHGRPPDEEPDYERLGGDRGPKK